MRLMKIGEEYGEAVAAYIGVTGQNPRKGVTHTLDDLAGELCDVVITALIALASLTGTAATAEAAMNAHLARRSPRLATLLTTLRPQLRNLAKARLNGSLDRMMTLAGELDITAGDLRDLPHQIAAEIAEGCIQDERSHGHEVSRDWHAVFRAEADEAVTGGLEGLIAYLLGNFYEADVADTLRHEAACKPPF
ncbi:MazG-like family protein [Nonomuraea sp. NPDC003707]